MSTMGDFDLEIQDERDSNPEHFEGSVATAGSSVTITPTNAQQIQKAIIISPKRGPNANGFNDVLKINIDGTTKFIHIARGESLELPGVFTSLKIDALTNGVNYEIIVWS